jgi:tellurite methyltransferase
MKEEIRDLHNRSVNFFDLQFQQQAAAAAYVLNPFEQAVLPFLDGDVLELGCGLGNLSVAAAARHCRILALDASPTAIGDLQRRANQDRLAIQARVEDLRHFAPLRSTYNSVVAIGLLMFFAKRDALTALDRIKAAVKPGGVAALNVLLKGTTYMDMFEPDEHYLFGEDELPTAFSLWKIEFLRFEDFAAPGETVKRFCTLIARRPIPSKDGIRQQ